MSALRILMLMNRIPFPLNDGGAIGSYNFIKGYAEAGAEVTVLAMNTAKHFVERDMLKDNILKYAQLHDVFVDNRIKPLPALLNLLKSTSYITERFESEAYRQALIQLLQKNEYDWVHVDGLPSALYIDVVRQHSNAKISIRAHNVEYNIWKRIAEQETNPFKKRYLQLQSQRLRNFETEAWRKVDVTLAISREDELMIISDVPQAKTIIVPAGWDIPADMPKGNTNAFPLFFIGSFDWMPNLQGIKWFVKDILPTLTKQFPDLKINIAGKKIPQEIVSYQSPFIHIAGEVPDAKEFMLSNGVMIVPIVSGSGIRIKILEAMALGKCVIATTIAAEGLGLSNGENVLIADSADGFAQQLNRCISNVDFAQQVGKSAYHYVRKNYSNQSVIEQLLHYYCS